MSIPIAFVEHEKRVLDMLNAVFRGDSNFLVLGTFTTVNSAIRKIPQLDPAPQVVLMDIQFPSGSGNNATRALKAAMPSLLVVVLTALQDPDTLFAALKSGADGYLLKRTPPAGIVTAVEEVLAGGSPMTAGIARRVIKYFATARNGSRDVSPLSETESMILESKIQHGGSSKELAGRFRVAPSTIDSHFKTILKKLSVSDRADAVAVHCGARKP